MVLVSWVLQARVLDRVRRLFRRELQSSVCLLSCTIPLSITQTRAVMTTMYPLADTVNAQRVNRRLIWLVDSEPLDSGVVGAPKAAHILTQFSLAVQVETSENVIVKEDPNRTRQKPKTETDGSCRGCGQMYSGVLWWSRRRTVIRLQAAQRKRKSSAGWRSFLYRLNFSTFFLCFISYFLL